MDELTLNVTAVNSGIASDNKVIIDGGNIGVSAGNEGIKSEPENTVDETTGEVTLEDTVSEGAITINNGTVVVEASGDGVQAYNNMVINAGNVKVNFLGDGLQATNMTINNGRFDITTNGGYTTVLNDNSDSCKGIKATSTISINNGSFTINSADDAIHTNEYVYLLGGTFDIKTGDDGAHADTSLFVGEENAENEKLNINISSSYEGLEAGTVYFYSGNVNVVSSDDGLDSNGSINIADGVIVVFGAPAGKDNAPYDCESQFSITGGTVFGAGSSQMAVTPTSTQKYVMSRNSIAQGKNIVVSDSSLNSLFATEAVKNVNYVVYSSPELVNGENYTISATNAAIVTPTVKPTVEPTIEPTAEPTAEPTSTPVSVKKINVQVTSKNSSSLIIKWDKVSDADYYEIYRADSKNGTYKKVATITKASKTTYVNKNLKSGKKYYYKIRSYKKVNGKKVYGEYSAVKSGKVK